MSRYVRVSTLSFSPCLKSMKGEHQTTAEFVISHLDSKIGRAMNEKPDLVVLPEVCDRPHGLDNSSRIAYYKERAGSVRDFLSSKARQNGCYIVYPHYEIMPDGTSRNCCEMLDRSGKSIGVYNKNYPTIGEMTDMRALAGVDIPLFECDFGKVAAAICFDLNFDDLRLRMRKADPDLIVFCSNFHGGILQNFFAYDTRSYLVSSIGFDRVPGTVVSPVGEVISHTTNYYSHVTKDINLDYAVCHLDYNIERIDRAIKKYGKGIRMDDPGYLGAVLLSCETDETTMADIVKEFDIELIDHYIERSIDFRNKNTEY